jgi:hypothetical protein
VAATRSALPPRRAVNNSERHKSRYVPTDNASPFLQIDANPGSITVDIKTAQTDLPKTQTRIFPSSICSA